MNLAPPRPAPPDLAADARLLTAAVRDAGAVALDYFHRGARFWDKAANDPVSEADLAVDASLQAALAGSRPDYGWLSEEGEDDPRRLACQRTWVVDPIDGTRAFLKGRDTFVVSAALVERGRPVAAAIFRPVTGDLFTAERGAGARLNDAPIKAPATDRLEDAAVLGDAGLFRSERLWPVPWPAVRCSGGYNAIALRICLVAAGAFDATVSLRPTNDWDLAAAELILEEAGGVCVSHMAGPHAYNTAKPKPPFVVAAAAGLEHSIMKRMVPALVRGDARPRD